jgi:hypothetical protein
MAGLNLFDNDAILQEYNFLSNNLKRYTENITASAWLESEVTKSIEHKKIIQIIRDVN